MTRYESAKEIYAKYGVDTDAAIAACKEIPVSLHCWQGDDVIGFDHDGGLTGGIQTTGNYPGKARTPQELLADMDKAMSLMPGAKKINVHACYAIFEDGEFADRDKLEPKHFWPWLQLLSTWKCGNTKIYMEKYLDQFNWDKTFYQELGYIATECRFGFSLDDTNESVLFPHFHYYEFVEESELDHPHKHFLQLHELEVGKRYCAYVTTYSGLFRYNMNDLVEVGGKFYNTPTVHMVSKVNGIVSMTGEKLYEPQFIDAVHKAEELMDIKTKCFVGFADVRESKYHFYYEFVNEDIDQETADEFTKVVDRKLQEINNEYESKRASFRLKEPQAHILLSNAYARFKAACLRDGFRDGQFKFNLLMQDDKRRRKFDQIERTETLSDKIMELANTIDDNIKERQQKRTQRRTARKARRTKA